MTQHQNDPIDEIVESEEPAETHGGFTIEQQRAAFLLKKVQDHWLTPEGSLKEETRKAAQDYRRVVQRLPAMVMTNGLPQVLAFLLSQPTNAAAQKVVKDLSEALVDLRGLYRPNDGMPPTSLIQRIVAGTREDLRLATDETLALSTWWVRFVRAFIASDTHDPPTS